MSGLQLRFFQKDGDGDDNDWVVENSKHPDF